MPSVTTATVKGSKKSHFFLQRLKTGPGPGPWTWEKTDSFKNGLVQKYLTSRPTTLLFVSWHMKDSLEVIHFHVKSRGTQGLVFVQITFARCTINFYFEKDKVDIKTTIADLYSLLVWNISAYWRIFI